MAINKVIFAGNTLIDISDTTATADKILEGYAAYGANGQKIVGTYDLLLSKLEEDDSMTNKMFNLAVGGINPNTGTNTSSTARCRTAMMPCQNMVGIIFENNSYLVRIYGYSKRGDNASGTRAYLTDRMLNRFFLLPDTDTKFIKLSFARVDGAVLTTNTSDPESDWYIIQHSLKVYVSSDDVI